MTDVSENTVTVTQIGLGPYGQFVTVGRHVMGADEPKPLGGHDTGASPYEYLLAGLGACTAMTLRMYSARKSWPLEKIAVELRHDKIAAPSGTGKIDRFERGDPSDRGIDQRADVQIARDSEQVPGQPDAATTVRRFFKYRLTQEKKSLKAFQLVALLRMTSCL